MRPAQQALAASGFERYRKRTRREQILADMNPVVPWGPLVELIAPVYPKGEGAGRPPVGLEWMLCIHCLQHWFKLSDPAVEEALYDLRAMCEFVGIDLGREPVPDETTICRFRHLLEAHELSPQILAALPTSPSRALRSAPARSSMRRSSARRARPRSATASATRRCTRPRRATSGTSA
jgi:hypothetical protein